MSILRSRTTERPRRPSRRRGARPRLESLEPRELLTAGAFIQGTAFIDQNGTGRLDATDPYLPGAIIQLFSGTTQIGQATTGPHGQYLFDDTHNLFAGKSLTPGIYKVVEVPPSPYLNSSASALSQVNPATVVSPSTIQVTVVDPSKLTTTFDYSAYGSSSNYERVYPIFNGQPLYPGNTRALPTGQLPIIVNRPGIGPTPEFFSFCTDITQDLTGQNTYSTPPGPTPAPPGIADNAGRIGYLYNHYGVNPDGVTTPKLSRIDAGALQLAINILEYNTNVPANPTVAYLSTGNFQIGTAADDATKADFTALQTRILALLADSAGKDEKVMFLNAIPGGTAVGNQGLQSMLCTDSEDFGNDLDTTGKGGCPVTCITYTDYGPCGTTTFTSLGGKTHAGDQVTVDFTVTGTTPAVLTLVTYTATSNFDLTKQTVYTVDTQTFTPGRHSLTVTIPDCYYQIDFVCGNAITKFDPTNNVTYHGQNRFIDADRGGSQNAQSCYATLSGVVFLDKNNDLKFNTGAGDVGLGGVTVTLTGTDAGGQKVLQTRQTAADGSYSFMGLPPSNSAGYTVTESQPANLTHEGQVVGSTGGTTGNHSITTVLAVGANSTSNNFAEVLPCAPSNVSYTVSGSHGTATFSTLAGHTHPGDKVTVNFTVTGTLPATFTLVSYVAPSDFDLTKQTVYCVDTQTFAPGKHSLTVTIPDCYYQIDFVCGNAITKFDPTNNVTYHGQNRFIDADSGSYVAPPDDHHHNNDGNND